MARPRKKVNGGQVEKLAAIGCTIDEIATIVDCSKNTLERRFGAELRKGREHLKMRLRRKQILVALSGNATMLIWLGKQYLDQYDRQIQEGDENRPIKIIVERIPYAADQGL